MAGDVRRTYAAAASAARLVSSSCGLSYDQALEGVSHAILDALSACLSGHQRDVVVEACRQWALDTVEQFWVASAQELAHLTDLPLPAARTSAGQHQALRDAGFVVPEDFSRDDLCALPGTPLVLAVMRVSDLSELAAQLADGVWPAAFAAAFDGQTRDGSFDRTIEALRPEFPLVSEVGWALITFETHKHVNLIWHQANKLVRSFPERSASDLLGWGWVGLRTALRLFDPDLGFAFSTYACSRVIGSIRDGVRSENPVPKRLNTFTRKVAAVEAELTQRLGRSPTLEEVSASIGVELESLAILQRTAPAASVEEVVSGLGDRGVVPSWLVASQDTEDLALSSLQAEAITRALSELPEAEAQAVRLLVMEGLNPTEARQLTGATARQLRQRKERGLAALRQSLQDWSVLSEQPS